MQRKLNAAEYAWKEPDAKRYLRESERSDVQYRAFIAHLKELSSPARILDVGAGPGPLTARIAACFPAATITALEISPVMTELGREYIRQHGLQDRVAYVLADAGSPQALEDIGPYDLICSCYSVHEWRELRRVVMQLRLILTDGGSMVLHDLRRVSWLAWLPLRLPMLESIRASYTIEELRTLLAGLPDSEVTVQTDAPFLLTAKIRATSL